MYAPSRFGYGFVTRFQRCISRTVMRTIVPRTHFAYRYRRACVYCLHECLVCATMSFRPPMPPLVAPGRRQRPCPHACTARPHHYCLHVLFPGLEPPGCRSGPYQPFWLDACVVIISKSTLLRSSSREAFGHCCCCSLSFFVFTLKANPFDRRNAQ